MKKTKKLWAFLLAMIMVLAMGMSAMAAGTGSITITQPEGTSENATNTYKIYKVFDADGDGTNISYKLVNGKTEAPAGFKVDDAGNVLYDGAGTDTNGDDIADALTAADIAAIAAYVANDTPVAEKTATGNGEVVIDGLPNGYYYITTSTGTVVTIDSTNPNVEVEDKNTVPTLNKIITGASSVDADGKKALAQVGTEVEYTATITVGKGAKGYVFHDTMSAGLTLKSDSIVVEGVNSYTVKETPDDGDTLTITFEDGLVEGTVITIKYSAIINDNALTNDPENNTAYLSFGDSNSNNKTPNYSTQTWNAQISVVKKDGNNTEETSDDQPLAGAGFVLKNSAGKFYHLNTENGKHVVVWVDDIANADEHISGVDGTVPPFTGLANGTYTLVEKTVPAGFNTAADTDITIKEHDYTAENLEQTASVINNKGAVLPSTGGVGTTMFYVLGGALVLVAVVLLVTRKRMNVEK